MIVYNWFIKVRMLLRERGVVIAHVKDVLPLRIRHKTMVVLAYVLTSQGSTESYLRSWGS